MRRFRCGRRHLDVARVARVAIDFAALRPDRLPIARCVAVVVFLACRVVRDDCRADDHGEWALGIVSWPTRPFDRAWGIVRITACPRTKLDLHRSLWVGASGFFVGHCPHDCAADVPRDSLRGPVDCVRDELSLVVRCWVELTPAIAALGTLAEVVGLHGLVVGAEPFHVDLVQRIRQHDERADNAGSRGGFHGYFDTAEHDIKNAGQLWGIALLCHGEGHAVAAVGGCAAARDEGVNLAFCEVDIDASSESYVGGAGV